MPPKRAARQYENSSDEEDPLCDHIHPEMRNEDGSIKKWYRDNDAGHADHVKKWNIICNNFKLREILLKYLASVPHSIRDCPNPKCGPLFFYVVEFSGWTVETEWGTGKLILEGSEIVCFNSGKT